MRKALVLISFLFLAGCCYKGEDRFTAQWQDVGVDVRKIDGQVDSIYVEGIDGAQTYELRTGKTTDGKDYLLILRQE